MANVCDTCYKIYGSEEDLSKINDILNKIDKAQTYYPRICQLVEALGKDTDKYPTRGEIYYHEHEDECLMIEMNTAWCEQENARRAIQEAFPNVTIYYYDEEPGCDNFRTNDPNGGCYIVDEYDNPEYNHPESLRELRECIESITGKTISPDATFGQIEQICDEYTEVRQEEDPDYYLSIHEMVVVDD